MSETAAGPSGPGTVVMELGADVGALILYTPAEMDGEEIEISRDDEPGAAGAAGAAGSARAAGSAGSAGAAGSAGSAGVAGSAGSAGARRTHSQVRPRHMPGETRYAAVYPGLPAGRYTVWRDEHRPAAAVTVTGGQVSNCRWPG